MVTESIRTITEIVLVWYNHINGFTKSMLHIFYKDKIWEATFAIKKVGKKADELLTFMKRQDMEL